MTIKTQDKKTPAEVLRFREYLQAKDLSNATQAAYTRYVNAFLEWNEKEIIQLEKADISDYLTHLKTKRNQQNNTRNHSLIALKHYFTFLQKEGLILENPTTLLKIRGTKKKKLYNIYSFEELTQLADDYYTNFVQDYNDNHIPKNQQEQAKLSKQRNYAMLTLLLCQGLVTSELQTLKLTDVDCVKAVVKITGGRKSNAKTIPLQASQIGALLHYMQVVRPQLLTYQNNPDTAQMFLNLPEVGRKTTDSSNVQGVLKNLSKQMKSMDVQFVNFKQIRASVITHWIRTQGVRKAQYFAGHRYATTTQNYQPNDLENLLKDVASFNPYIL